MTITQVQDAVLLAAQTQLPARLATAGLVDFSYYGIDYQSSDTIDELLVLLNSNEDTRENDSLSLLLRAQLLGGKRTSAYGDVLKQFVIDILRPHLLGYTYIDKISLDFWPLNIKTNLQFIYCDIIYAGVLDDCD